MLFGKKVTFQFRTFYDSRTETKKQLYLWFSVEFLFNCSLRIPSKFLIGINSRKCFHPPTNNFWQLLHRSFHVFSYFIVCSQHPRLLFLPTFSPSFASSVIPCSLVGRDGNTRKSLARGNSNIVKKRERKIDKVKNPISTAAIKMGREGNYARRLAVSSSVCGKTKSKTGRRWKYFKVYREKKQQSAETKKDFCGFFFHHLLLRTFIYDVVFHHRQLNFQLWQSLPFLWVRAP